MVKPSSLRVGGSAWELKTNTKRLEDKKNNNFKQESEMSGAKHATNVARRGPETILLTQEDVLCALRSPRGAPRGDGSAAGVFIVRMVKLLCSETCAPAFRRQRIFESGQRVPGVRSKAHKFANGLRALLAIDKHLGSAERSERQLPKQTRPQVPKALWRISVRFAEAAALSFINRMWRCVWESRCGSP